MLIKLRWYTETHSYTVWDEYENDWVTKTVTVKDPVLQYWDGNNWTAVPVVVAQV